MLGVLLGVLLFSGFLAWNLPDRINPFSPLDLAHEPNLVTAFKMRFVENDPAVCRAVMDRAADLSYAPSAISSPEKGCGAPHALRLLQSRLNYGGGVRLACPAMTRLMLWERHAVRPAAADILGVPIERVLHYGTYACRNVNNAEAGRRSAHARAEAIDIAGFELEDGRVITVRGDWGADTPAGRFLARVHEGACGMFGAVLGPDYNAAHADHFHLESSGWGMCR